jgi:FtsH-binding integral membrane protein
MSSILSFDAQDLPDVEYAGPPTGRRRQRDPRTALQWAYLPMIITVIVNAIFLVGYWVPEFARFPGHAWLFDQLAPLASASLTSRGEPVAAVQAGRGSSIPTFLLLASLPLPALFRARQWQLRLVIPALFGYLGAMGLVITVLGLLARGQLTGSVLGVALMALWVVAVGVTVYRLIWVSTDDLPRRPVRVLWLVVLIALLHPLPIAIGRRIFAPELQAAAHELLASGQDALLYAALVAPASVAVYLSGVAVALVGWASYMLIPPWRPVRTPWAWKAAGDRPPAVLGRLLLLGLSIVALAVTGGLASHGGQARAQQIALGSPADDLALTCASWTRQPDQKPAQTLALSGADCSTVTAFSGYAQVARHELGEQVAPVRAETPEDTAIKGRVVGAQYGPVVVVASTDGTGFGGAPDQLQGIRVVDGHRAWTFRCDDDGDMRLRFAGSDAGDDPSAGRITEFLEKPSVVAACSNATVSINPATGKKLKK